MVNASYRTAFLRSGLGVTGSTDERQAVNALRWRTYACPTASQLGVHKSKVPPSTGLTRPFSCTLESLQVSLISELREHAVYQLPCVLGILLLIAAAGW